jgi:tRNA(Ile)-lysidine synthase TilS/MesJ
MGKKKVRHIMGLSGGKDSTAPAILLHKEIPDIEYFFCLRKNCLKPVNILKG